MATAKEIVGVDCDGPADVAISNVLGSRLEEMCLLRGSALNFSDPEGVHDMRVASRRLRSALRDFAPYLRKTKLHGAMREVKKVADALGTVRDQDVSLMALDELRKKAPTEVATGVQLLIETQNSTRGEHRRQLTTLLSQKAVAQLKSTFMLSLEASVIPSTGKKRSKEPLTSYRTFAQRTILKRLHELEKLSPSLYEPLRTKPLHKMRIAAKRLRYALELFAPCWPETLDAFARQVARLQMDLGELHDCDMWVDYLGHRLNTTENKKGRSSTSADERAALVWLLGHFTKMRAKHYRAALDRWHEWKAKDLMNNLTAALEK